MKFLGDNLRKFREEAGLSREALAQKIKKNGRKITVRTIINWEKGPRKPDADSLAQMHEIFKKDLILFFEPVSYQNALLSSSKSLSKPDR